MGLFDALFGMFGQQGATVTQNVTSTQPTTSGGTTYTTPGGGSSFTSQPAQPAPIQTPLTNPIGWASGAINYAGNLIGGGIQTVQQQVQTIPQPAAAAPIILAANPITLPLILGGAIAAGINQIAPQPINQPMSNDGAVYTNKIIAPITPATFYVPYGNQAQIEIQNAKAVYDPTSGSVGFYQVPYGHSIGNVISSGGPGALQSGMFTYGAAETPVVYTQENAAQGVLASGVNVAAAQQVLSNPAAFSRLGAEAYGGVVQPLDNRVLTADIQMSRYPAETGNLANLVNPTGVNQPKSTWAEIPWQIAYQNQPVIQSINTQGVMTAISPAGMASIGMQPVPERLIGGGMVAGSPEIINNPNAPIQTLRPSDFDLWAMQNTGGFAPLLIGASDFFVGGRTMVSESSVAMPTTMTTETGKPWTVTKELQPGIFEITTFTPSLTTKTGGTLTTVTSTPIPRGFDIGEEQFTKQVMNAVPAMNPAKPTGNVALDYFAGFGRGAYEGVRTKPLTSLVNVGIGLAFVAGGEIIAGIGEGAVAATQGMKVLGPLARGTTFFATKITPAALMGLYTIDVTGRTTAWGKDTSPAAAERFGGITSTEIIPMMTGGLMYHPIATKIGTMEIGYTKAIQTEATTGRLDYYIKQPLESTYNKIPSVDQVRYKFIELREPSSAMSVPSASERFIQPSQRFEDFTGSAKSYLKAKSYSELFGESRGGGSVSSRPTPRQESLKLNYNPTARLTEIDLTALTPKFAQKGEIGGIRGTLRGKWDTGLTGREDSFANLPLKERWKMRTGVLSDTGGVKGYYGGGTPTGGLQSGVGIGGTTVRSGRQVIEMRMPSSGIPSEIESLAPQQLEIIPTQRTAQRSRAYDLEYEYQSRKIPEGMRRPSPASETISERNINLKTDEIPIFVPLSEIHIRQQQEKTTLEKQITRQETTIIPREDILSKARQDTLTSTIQKPILKTSLGILTVLSILQQPRQIQIQSPVSITDLSSSQITASLPIKITEQIRSQSSEQRSRQQNIVEEISRITQTPKTTTETRVITDIVPEIQIRQDIYKVPTPPEFPKGGTIGGGGGGGSYGYRGEKSWTTKNPVGADLMASKRKMNFKPMKGMKVKKF
jgi:hypothetical protein